MALTYRIIDASYAETVWNAEQSGPRWFVDASKVWNPTYESFLAFWKSNAQIFGLFDGETLLACIYLEYLPNEANVHISIIEKTPERDLVRFFQSVKRQKAIEGQSFSSGWILSRNRVLLAIAEKAGYRSTGLYLDHGQSRGKILRWIKVEAR